MVRNDYKLRQDDRNDAKLSEYLGYRNAFLLQPIGISGPSVKTLDYHQTLRNARATTRVEPFSARASPKFETMARNDDTLQRNARK